GACPGHPRLLRGWKDVDAGHKAGHDGGEVRTSRKKRDLEETAVLKVKSLYTEYASDNGTVVKAAQDVSFEVPEGKLFTLLGPSGCGKTTTLRSIAGLERPTSGEIAVSGRAGYSSRRGIFAAPN